MKILIDHMIASRLALLALCFGVAYVAWLIIARLLLSPIRHFPGPKWAALTDWWDIYHIIKCAFTCVPVPGLLSKCEKL